MAFLSDMLQSAQNFETAMAPITSGFEEAEKRKQARANALITMASNNILPKGQTVDAYGVQIGNKVDPELELNMKYKQQLIAASEADVLAKQAEAARKAKLIHGEIKSTTTLDDGTILNTYEDGTQEVAMQKPKEGQSVGTPFIGKRTPVKGIDSEGFETVSYGSGPAIRRLDDNGQPIKTFEYTKLEQQKTIEENRTKAMQEEKERERQFKLELAKILNALKNNGGKITATMMESFTPETLELYQQTGNMLDLKPVKTAAEVLVDTSGAVALGALDTMEQVHSDLDRGSGLGGRVGNIVKTGIGKVAGDPLIASFDVASTLAAKQMAQLYEKGKVTNEDFQQYLGSLPKASDTPAQVKNKLKIARSLLKKAIAASNDSYNSRVGMVGRALKTAAPSGGGGKKKGADPLGLGI